MWDGSKWVLQTENNNCNTGYEPPSSSQVLGQRGQGSSSSQTANVNCVAKPMP
jgi:hypothetical protein